MMGNHHQWMDARIVLSLTQIRAYSLYDEGYDHGLLGMGDHQQLMDVGRLVLCPLLLTFLSGSLALRMSCTDCRPRSFISHTCSSHHRQAGIRMNHQAGGRLGGGSEARHGGQLVSASAPEPSLVCVYVTVCDERCRR